MTSRRLLAGGSVGGVLLAVGGTGAGALPPSGWDLLHDVPRAALVLCWLGVALLCAAWWLSRRCDLSHQRAACLVWAAPLLLAPPLFSRDLYAYAGQGALVSAGRDPYVEGPGALPGPSSEGVDEVWLDAPAPYGPVWLALAGLVVRLTGESVVGALVGLRLLAVVGVALAAWALLRLSRPVAAPSDAASPEDGAGAARALWLGVANPLVLLHLVAGGHNDALMVGLLAAGVAVAATAPTGGARTAVARTAGSRAAGARTAGTLAAAAALVTLAALVKVPAAAGLAYLPLLAAPDRAQRLRGAAVVLATAVVTATAVSAGTGLGWGWLGALDTGRARLSLFSPLTGLGTAVGALEPVLAAGLLAAALASLALLVTADRVGPLRALGLTLLVASLLLPVVHPWYLLWAVVLLAGVTGPRAAAALGAACLVLCLTVAPSGRSVVRPPLYGLPTLLAGAVGLLVLRAARADAPGLLPATRTI